MGAKLTPAVVVVLFDKRETVSIGGGGVILSERAITPDVTTLNTYTYSSSEWGDLLTAFNGNAITYDNLGNPLSYYNGSRYAFTWQGRRLVGAVKGTSTMSFTYDDNGLRTSKTVNGVTTEYLLATVQNIYIKLAILMMQIGNLISLYAGEDFMKWIDKKHLFINLVTSVLNNGERHAEVITDKPKELIDAIYEDADRISTVIFWDRASVKEGSSIGYGGPLDSRDHDYYFAETEEILSVLPDATKEELLNYIGIIQSKYSIKLYVGFMVDLLN